MFVGVPIRLFDDQGLLVAITDPDQLIGLADPRRNISLQDSSWCLYSNNPQQIGQRSIPNGR
jgi:hypothetical protein